MILIIKDISINSWSRWQLCFMH